MAEGDDEDGNRTESLNVTPVTGNARRRFHVARITGRVGAKYALSNWSCKLHHDSAPALP